MPSSACFTAVTYSISQWICAACMLSRLAPITGADHHDVSLGAFPVRGAVKGRQGAAARGSLSALHETETYWFSVALTGFQKDHSRGAMLATQKGALRGAALPAPCRPSARCPAVSRARTVRVAARKLDKRSIKKVRRERSGIQLCHMFAESTWS